MEFGSLKDLWVLVPLIIYSLLLGGILSLLSGQIAKDQKFSEEAVARSVLKLGVACYFVFFAYLWHKNLGIFCTLSLLALSFKGLPGLTKLPKIYRFVPLLAIFYLLICHLPYPLKATSELDRMRVLFGLSLDNELPELVAEILRRGGDLRVEMLDWKSSDRPPLQTGFYLAFSFFKATAYYQALCTLLNLLWIPAVGLFLKKFGFNLDFRKRFYLLAPLTGFFFVHSVYVWPKMLAASLFFFSLALLPSLFWSVLALVLAFLSHSGMIFAMPLWLVLSWPQLKSLKLLSLGPSKALAFPVSLAFSWMAYQRFYDPPGDRLAKMHMAGYSEITNLPLTELIYEAYRSLSPIQWLELKWSNIKTIFYFPFSPNHLASWRVFEFFNTVGALSLSGILGLIVFVVNFKKMSPILKQISWGVILSFLLWSLILLGPSATSVHQGAFATQIFLFILALAGLQLFPRRFFYFLLSLQFLCLMTIWSIGLWFTQVSHATGFNYWALCFIFLLGFFCYRRRDQFLLDI